MGDGRGGSRGKFVKPVLAGAGVLSALFLLAPAVFGENAPSQTVQAGADDTDDHHTPELYRPDNAPSSAQPRATESGSPKDYGSKQSGADRIAAVAAASTTTTTTHEARLLESTPSGPTAAPTKSPRTDTSPRESATPQQHDWTTTVVNATSVLEPGQRWSTNRIDLTFQGDGNLVLTDKRGNPLWSSGTSGRGAKTVFQADGNLVVYTPDGGTAWSSLTMGHDGARLVLEADGNMTVRQGGTVIWSTGTSM
ncbi:hypothetical protein [Streptomyces flaveolus]|uniref:hypothetical protein n=1 Tax=Streptomyces flaveolus TaxID=67297 RepID=UPI0036FB7E50